MLHSDHMDQWSSLHVNVFCSPLVYASTSCSHDGGGSISDYHLKSWARRPASPTDSPRWVEIVQSYHLQVLAWDVQQSASILPVAGKGDQFPKHKKEFWRFLSGSDFGVAMR